MLYKSPNRLLAQVVIYLWASRPGSWLFYEFMGLSTFVLIELRGSHRGLVEKSAYGPLFSKLHSVHWVLCMVLGGGA